MKSNPLLKWLLIPMALLLVFVGIKLFSGAPGGQPAPKGAASTLTPEEMKALGIAGDTPRDTVATLVAQVKQLRNELQTALTDNKNQKAENERMRAREGAIDQRIVAKELLADLQPRIPQDELPHRARRQAPARWAGKGVGGSQTGQLVGKAVVRGKAHGLCRGGGRGGHLLSN